MRLLEPATCKRVNLSERIREQRIAIFFAIKPITLNNRSYYTSDSDWSRAFNQFTIACELDMINAISAADIAFIMSSSTSAWLLSPLKCSPQKQNGWTLRFCFWGWIMWKMHNKTIIDSVFAWYHELSKPRVCVICRSRRLRQITQTSVLIIHGIMLNLI